MTNSPTSAQAAKWEQLRFAGDRINDAVTDLVHQLEADNALDRLAIIAGMQPALDKRIDDTIAAALDAHALWPEIAEAIGEGSDRTSYQRVRAAYHRRRQTGATS